MRILLTTLHAKYVHSSLALPSLAAACNRIEGAEVVIREFTINEPPAELLRRIVAEEADLAAFSCYIWNIEATLRLIADLKQILPRTLVVLGGPEVSYGAFELMEKNPGVDCIVRGEGEATFRELAALLAETVGGDSCRPVFTHVPGLIYRDRDDIIATVERADLADLDVIPSPFAAGLADLNKPLVYYETSRGCPFSCAFCLSSLEKGVRSFSRERIEADLMLLMARGVKTVKLVDRTFNYDPERANAIWEFILGHNRESRFHFEIAADLLTETNLRLLERVPPGMFQFEIGVQSGEEETLARVARRSDLDRLFAAVGRLKADTAVTIHLDLVAGLPHEDFAGFLRSLQSLLDAAPHHIQVEPLKVLKGSAMRRIAMEEEYRFSASPPYTILRTPWLSFREITRIEGIARCLDLYYNSGRFGATLAVLAAATPLAKLFDALAAYREKRPVEGASLAALFNAFWDFIQDSWMGEERVREALCFDYCRADYPVAGRLPRFFPAGTDTAERGRKTETIAALAGRLGIAGDSRVRIYRHRFSRDFRVHPDVLRTTELLFVYISAPGNGMEVRVLEDDGGASAEG
jgi:radical SAM superfamily enzyme YgiQ (UPF0313 family)